MSEKTSTASSGGFRQLLPYFTVLRDQLGSLALVVSLMLASTAISLAIPLFAGDLVDRLASGEGMTAGRQSLMILGGLLVTQLLSSFLYQYISRRLGLRTVTRLRRRLFGHLLSLPSLYFTHKKAGDLSSRMTSDVGSIQYLLTTGMVTLGRATLTLVGALVLMYRLNVQLTLVVLLLVPGTVLLVSVFGRHLRRLSRQMYDELGELSNHVQEMAGAIRAIKVFASENHEQARFERRLDGFLGAGTRRALLAAALDSGVQILLWTCLIVVVVYGFYLSSRGEASYGELVSFMLLAFRVATPMGALTGLYTSTQGAVAAADRLDEVLRVPAESETMGRPLTDTTASRPRITDGSGRIDILGVQFSYDGEPEAPRTLANIDLTIAGGEKVALVGPSGAGKTTLACLVLRLFDPHEGSLQLGGRDYRDFDLQALRRRMAYVPQEAILYDASIEDNIRFGLTEVPVEAVRLAASRAQALEFIERAPHGFETLVGDRGVRLSGGERQRLALARAFLRNPDILVLDEPTSALDAANESAIRKALTELMAGRTTIMVAHRLSLVRDLDRIIVLDKGVIREQGPHSALVDQNGLYAQLYRLQHET